MICLVNGAVCDGLAHLKIKPLEVRQLYLSDIDLPYNHATLRALLKVLKGSVWLEQLSLVRCCITDTLLEELLGVLRSSPSKSRIRHLSLECNRLSNKGLASLALFFTQSKPPITRLNIGNCMYSMHGFAQDTNVSLLRIKALMRPVRLESDDAGLLYIQTPRKVPKHSGNAFSSTGVSYLLENLYRASYMRSNLTLQMLNICGTCVVMTFSLVQKLLRFNTIGYMGMNFSDLYGEKLLFEDRQALSLFFNSRVIGCIDTENGIFAVDAQCMRSPDLYIHNCVALTDAPDRERGFDRSSPTTPIFQHNIWARGDDSPSMTSSQGQEPNQPIRQWQKIHRIDALSSMLSAGTRGPTSTSTSAAAAPEVDTRRRSDGASSWIMDAFHETAQNSLDRDLYVTRVLDSLVKGSPGGGAKPNHEDDCAPAEQTEVTDDDYQEVEGLPSLPAQQACDKLQLSYDEGSSYIAPEFIQKLITTAKPPSYRPQDHKSLLELAELSSNGHAGDPAQAKDGKDYAAISTAAETVTGDGEAQVTAHNTQGGIIRRRPSLNPSSDFALGDIDDRTQRARSLPSRSSSSPKALKRRPIEECVFKFVSPPVLPLDNLDEFPSVNPLCVDVRRSFVGRNRSSIVQRLFLQ